MAIDPQSLPTKLPGAMLSTITSVTEGFEDADSSAIHIVEPINTSDDPYTAYILTGQLLHIIIGPSDLTIPGIDEARKAVETFSIPVRRVERITSLESVVIDGDNARDPMLAVQIDLAAGASQVHVEQVPAAPTTITSTSGESSVVAQLIFSAVVESAATRFTVPLDDAAAASAKAFIHALRLAMAASS